MSMKKPRKKPSHPTPPLGPRPTVGTVARILVRPGGIWQTNADINVAVQARPTFLRKRKQSAIAPTAYEITQQMIQLIRLLLDEGTIRHA